MGEFKYGFCGCFNNTHLCIVTWFLPCVTAGRNSEIMGDNCLVCGALYCIASPIGVYYQALNRQKIREQRSIEVSLQSGRNWIILAYCVLYYTFIYWPSRYINRVVILAESLYQPSRYIGRIAIGLVVVSRKRFYVFHRTRKITFYQRVGNLLIWRVDTI